MFFQFAFIQTKAISSVGETNKLILSAKGRLWRGTSVQIASTWMEQLENVQYHLLRGQLEFLLIFGSPKIYKF